MKHTIKAIFLFFTAALLITSCGEDSTPPIAGFTMSDLEPTQWGTSTIISTADHVGQINYEVSGGEYVWVDAATIQFLEDHAYIVTQIVTNDDGEDSTSLTVNVQEPANTYKMSFYSDDELSVEGNAYWFSSMGALQIRFSGVGATAQETNNLVKINPIPGADPISGDGTRSYTWSADGEVDTYSSAFTHYPETGDSWDAAWFTSTAGNGLEITLIYDAEEDVDDIYEIEMTDTTLSGYYDASFSSQDGEGVVILSYTGKIDPVQ
jgi:hypothetical protein